MSADLMRSLMLDLGRSVGIEGLEPDEESRCNLMFDDIGVSFELAPGGESMYLYALLGVAGVAGREVLRTRLLDANYAFQGTGGATLGVEDSSGRVVAIREERLQGMGLARLEALVEEFVNLAEAWRDRLPGIAAEASAPARPADVGANAFRV